MRQFIGTVATYLVIIAVTALIILYGRGYRVDLNQKEVKTTGSLVATSEPIGAKVYVNGKFSTATNTTIPLDPGTYTIRIVKEGYIPWEKQIKIQREVVAKADPVLFPSNPSLSPLTLTGIINPIVSPDGTRIVFARKSPSASVSADLAYEETDGLWVLDLVSGPLGFNRDPRHIAHSSGVYQWEQSTLIWSSDSKQLMSLFLGNDQNKTTPTPTITKRSLISTPPTNQLAFKPVRYAYLLDLDKTTSLPNDITDSYKLILNQWQQLKSEKEKEKILGLPKELVGVATQAMHIWAFSPDETKVLYEATASAALPAVIDPPLLGTNSTPETRLLKAGNIYVYDLKEDKNYQIMKKDDIMEKSLKTNPVQILTGTENFPLKWYPTSHHLILADLGASPKITIMDYDGGNRVTVYAGPLDNHFLYPWPSSGKLLILTNLNASALNLPNLYLVNLR